MTEDKCAKHCDCCSGHVCEDDGFCHPDPNSIHGRRLHATKHTPTSIGRARRLVGPLSAHPPSPEPRWWEELEEVQEPSWPYARRVPAGARARTVAASIATSYAVEATLPSESHAPAEGHKAVLGSACRTLFGEERGCLGPERHTLIYDLDHGNNDPASESVDFEHESAARVVSAVVEPIVSALLWQTESDGSRTLRALEASLAGGILHLPEPKQSFVDVLACCASSRCALDAARRAGVDVLEKAEPVVEALAGVNERLVDAYRRHTGAVGAAARRAAERTHTEQVAHVWGVFGLTEGRRLKENVAPPIHGAPPPPSALEVEMKTASNVTCLHLAHNDRAMALKAHEHTMRLWMRMRGGGNGPRGTGDVCVDCQFPRFTVACRVHFAIVSIMMRRLFNEQLESEDGDARTRTRTRRLKREAGRRMDEVCCARFKDGREECDRKYCTLHAHKLATRRAMHTVRRLYERGHPSVSRAPLAGHVGTDIIEPTLHPHNECRFPTPTLDARECFARSVMHHMARKRDMTVEALQDKMHRFGIDLFEFFKMGERKSGASASATSASARRRSDAEVAARLLKEARLESGAGRRLNDAPKGSNEDLGATARRAGALHAGAHGAMRKGHEALQRLDLASTLANNDAPRQGFEWRVTQSSSASPLTALLLLQAEQGSLTSRFAGAVEGAHALAARLRRARASAHSQSVEKTKARRASIQSGRRAAARRLYDRLDAYQASSNATVSRAGLLSLPNRHALSWVHDMVGNWTVVIEHWTHIASVEHLRLEARRAGASHAEAQRAHPTGYDKLDRYGPSTVGEALRRLWHRKVHGDDPPWHAPEASERVRRRLESREDNDETPRPLRRLVSGFFETTFAAPFALYDAVLYNGERVPQSKFSFWEASLRYVVGSTVGCYLARPEAAPSDALDSEQDDSGDSLKVLRPSAEKLCFPACKNPSHRPT